MESDPNKEEITLHLEHIKAGDGEAVGRLLPHVYNDLRAVAARLFQGGGQRTLQPTALVHEVYLRLVDSNHQSYANRKHFFRVAAMAMRQLLTDYARARSSDKRGGGAARVALEDQVSDSQTDGIDLMALEEALEELARLDERVARTVELRVLAGLTNKEAAEALEVSERTARSDWNMGRAWLDRRFCEEPE